MFRRNKNGLFCIDLAKTWEKTMVAARIIAAIQDKNKKDVLVSARIKAAWRRAATLRPRNTPL